MRTGKEVHTSMSGKNILILETDAGERKRLDHMLRSCGHQVTMTAAGDDLLEKLTLDPYDLLLLCTVSPLTIAMALLQRIKLLYPDMPVIMVASGATPREAVGAMKAGALDFLIPPLERELIENLIWLLPDDASADVRSGEEKFRIVTQDAAMEGLLQSALKVADSRASVLIQGDSGTGKELIARYIHAHSRRCGHPFVAINCAALPATLLESELFGHEKGTFTGAMGRKKGKFELADGGTLLLDEISEMDHALQAKLLRVLQEREIDRVGGAAPVAVDVRILATTNRDLQEMMDAGEFREDLFFRLNVIPLKLPLLRERLQDIPLLATHFVEKYNRIDGKSVKGLTQASLDLLMGRSWRGNVRELENVIERAVLMSDGPYIEVEDLALTGVSRCHAPHTTQAFSPLLSLREMEEKVILHTLDHTNDNRTHAAKILGISVRTLRNKLNEYKEKMEAQ